ncbi:hypothetical protein QBC39DRAFT_258969, partial [Podospora conica]
ARSRILNYFPRYKPTGDTLKDFYYIKLILSYPYRSTAELLVIDDTTFDTYINAY